MLVQNLMAIHSTVIWILEIAIPVASVAKNNNAELKANNLKAGGTPDKFWHVLCHQDETLQDI